MRILIATMSMGRPGGVESYLSDVVPELIGRGCLVAVFCEHGHGGGERWLEDPTVPVYCADEAGTERALDLAAVWQPDVVYAHGLNDPEIERRVMALAPSVFFIHNYHGTCIAGAKRFARPTLQPCSRTFGPACLVYYLPRACGGRSPLTMVRLYGVQRARLTSVRNASMVVTHSFHMYQEYLKHGVSEERLRRFAYLAPLRSQPEPLPERNAPDSTRALKLLFVGRLERSKGVHLLLDAAPLVSRLLKRPVEVTVVGDGPEAERLRLHDVTVPAADVRRVFLGWLGREDVAQQYDLADVLVVPSAWPEPFGLVGVEAGRRGLPVAAFDVGGIRAWLSDGVNGFLAPAEPPTAKALAHAICACVRDGAVYKRLVEGASVMSQRFADGRHVDELVEILESAATPS